MFSYFRKPDIRWEPTSYVQTKIVSIGRRDSLLKQEPYTHRYQVWDQLFPVDEFCY